MMAVTNPKIYTLEQVLNIKENGFNFKISDSILNIINNISKQVGAPTYNKTPNFSKHNKKKQNGSGKNKREITPEDWGIIRNFKPTEKKEYTEIETSMNNIRGFLNKITDKNYDNQKDLIINKLDEIICSFTEKEATDVCDTVFNIAGGNKFYSSIYAQLFKELINKFEMVKKIFQSKLNDYLKLFITIETCDPNDNYDLFCDLNKKNDIRRSQSLFFVNLMKENIVEKNYILNLILQLQEKINISINQENQKSLVEEISENLYLLITQSYKDLKSNEQWLIVKENVIKISNENIKKNKSLSNKTVFKHLDILDEINN